MSVMHDTPQGATRPLDVEDACSFLTNEAEQLEHALDHRDTPAVVDSVLGRHDDSHATWLELIADAERRDDTVAAVIEDVYGFHGCVVGALERGVDPRLCPEVREGVRALLVRELESRTRTALQAIRRLGA